MKLIDHTILDYEQNAQANRLVIAQIDAGLTEFNAIASKEPSGVPLTLSVQSDNGAVVGGLLVSSAYGWMRVDVLWVSEQLRGMGFGKDLLDAAEQIAQERGCHGVHLDTHTFQAPTFYQRLGYEVFGELDNYPSEHKRVYLRKYFSKA